MYTQANLYHTIDDFKQEIKLQDAVTDKMIRANPMSNSNPKVISLQKTFEKLFPENKKSEIQTAEEITKRMRKAMKLQKI